MRALSSEFDRADPTDSFVGVLDQFAALRSYSADTIGGYRVLAPKRRESHSRARSAARHVASAAADTLATMTRARARFTGSLAVLFMGGLGLAVLAGPANCPCTTEAQMAQRSSLVRLGYAESAHFDTAREAFADQAELPAVTVAALVEPTENAAGVSPITTSALEPEGELAPAKRERLGTVSAGTLPSEIVQVSDAGPTVRLATAAGTDGDVLPELPMITVTTPSKPAKVAVADDDDEDAAPRAKRKKAMRAYRTPVAKSARHVARPGNDQFAVKRAPKWAQQMYVTPWQTQAFSYTR